MKGNETLMCFIAEDTDVTEYYECRQCGYRICLEQYIMAAHDYPCPRCNYRHLSDFKRIPGLKGRECQYIIVNEGLKSPECSICDEEIISMSDMMQTLHKAIKEFKTVNGIEPNQINITPENYERLIKELKPLFVIKTSSIIKNGGTFFEGIPLNISDELIDKVCI